MEIKELGYVICSHSDPLETSHNKPCICVSSYIVGELLRQITYVDRYSWLMHSKDTSTRVET
jgi:hypothetical protein